MGTASEDLVDEVLNADESLLAELLLNDEVIDDGNALVVDLSVSALVDKSADSLQRGVAVSDVGLNKTEHVDGSLVKLNEDSVVDLETLSQLL